MVHQQSDGPVGTGERLVAAWIRRRGFICEYEPTIGGRSPDFLVKGAEREFVMEVYEPTLRLPASTGSFSTYEPVRRVFDGRKRKQAQATGKEGIPFVAVLAETFSDIPLDPLLVAGAVLGDLSMEIPLALADDDADTETDRSTLVFGLNRQVQPTKNRSVSAVAVVRSFNPTSAALERRLRCIRDRGGEPQTRRDVFRQFDEQLRLERSMIETGEVKPHAAEARLVILHNPFATNPLPKSAAGRWDQQWDVMVAVTGESSYGVVAEGIGSNEVPGRT